MTALSGNTAIAFAAACVIALVAWPGSAGAQQGFADAMSGFSSNNNEPIAIEADQLEVRDSEKQAVFSGNVMVRQGEMVMRTKTLTVFYTGSAQGTENQDIDRLEADGGVVVTSGDQKATGASGVFDAGRDMITLTGDVVLSQGTNVLRGQTLVVDLAAGTSHILSDEDNGGSGRVKGLFVPKRDAN